jgi:hypothetical protein
MIGKLCSVAHVPHRTGAGPIGLPAYPHGGILVALKLDGRKSETIEQICAIVA